MNKWWASYIDLSLSGLFFTSALAIRRIFFRCIGCCWAVTILVGTTFHTRGFFHSNTPLTEFNVPSRKISGHLQKLKSRWKRGHSCGSQAEVEWTFHPGGIHPITRWDPSDPLKFCQTVFTRWRGVLHQSRELRKSWNFWGHQDIFGVIKTSNQFQDW